jgi:hypothetical protein
VVMVMVVVVMVMVVTVKVMVIEVIVTVVMVVVIVVVVMVMVLVVIVIVVTVVVMVVVSYLPVLSDVSLLHLLCEMVDRGGVLEQGRGFFTTNSPEDGSRGGGVIQINGPKAS